MHPNGLIGINFFNTFLGIELVKNVFPLIENRYWNIYYSESISFPHF